MEIFVIAYLVDHKFRPESESLVKLVINAPYGFCCVIALLV